MKRRLVNATALISLVLCFAVAALWAFSCAKAIIGRSAQLDDGGLGRESYTRWEVGIYRGCVGVERTRFEGSVGDAESSSWTWSIERRAARLAVGTAATTCAAR